MHMSKASSGCPERRKGRSILKPETAEFITVVNSCFRTINWNVKIFQSQAACLKSATMLTLGPTFARNWIPSGRGMRGRLPYKKLEKKFALKRRKKPRAHWNRSTKSSRSKKKSWRIWCQPKVSRMKKWKRKPIKIITKDLSRCHQKKSRWRKVTLEHSQWTLKNWLSEKLRWILDSSELWGTCTFHLKMKVPAIYEHVLSLESCESILEATRKGACCKTDI